MLVTFVDAVWLIRSFNFWASEEVKQDSPVRVMKSILSRDGRNDLTTLEVKSLE